MANNKSVSTLLLTLQRPHGWEMGGGGETEVHGFRIGRPATAVVMLFPLYLYLRRYWLVCAGLVV